MVPVPLQIGGPELIIVLLILAVFVVAGVLVVGGLVFLLRGRSGPDEDVTNRLDALEERVADLERGADGEEDDGATR